jgi:hypothetical protein
MKFLFTFVFVVLTIIIKGQQIEGVKANYKNDTLVILYDVTGKTKIDSIELNLSSYKKKYEFKFYGDIDKEIEPGKGKKIWSYIPRDSFPEQGESLKIRLKGWTKSTTLHKKWKRNKHSNFFIKSPKNPRFSFSSSVGVIFRSSEFSKIGQTLSAAYYYHPTNAFQIGLGGAYFNFLDSVKTFTTGHGFIATKYSLKDYQIPNYLLLNLGYSLFNKGPVATVGVGYKNQILGPFNFDLNARLHRFFGDYNFYSCSLNAGILVNLSSRKRFKKDRIHRFKDIMIYFESGINYLTQLSPNLSIDVSYKIAPNYTQGIGLSVESIKYKLKHEYNTTYYSTYYNQTREYIAGTNLRLKLFIVPVYLNGRLYLSTKRFRPYLVWKYGFTIYSKADTGDLQNGFVGDLGIGFQSPLNKTKALLFSAGIKFFDNQYNYGSFENDLFGTFFLKTGIVF